MLLLVSIVYLKTPFAKPLYFCSYMKQILMCCLQIYLKYGRSIFVHISARLCNPQEIPTKYLKLATKHLLANFKFGL
jgi:hypothetical protein